jgi:hypothetical protein
MPASSCSRRYHCHPPSHFRPCCPYYVQKFSVSTGNRVPRHLAYEGFVTVICHVFYNLFRRTGTRVPHPGAGPGWKSSVQSSLSFLSSSQVPVLRIRDVYPGSEFFHPGSQIQGEKDSSIRIRIKEYKYFFLSSQIYDPRRLSRIRILTFLPILDPGV